MKSYDAKSSRQIWNAFQKDMGGMIYGHMIMNMDITRQAYTFTLQLNGIFMIVFAILILVVSLVILGLTMSGVGFPGGYMLMRALAGSYTRTSGLSAAQIAVVPTALTAEAQYPKTDFTASLIDPEWKEILVMALIALHPCKALMKITAIQILVYDIHHIRPPISMLILVAIFPYTLKLFKIGFNAPVILTFPRTSRLIRLKFCQAGGKHTGSPYIEHTFS